MPWQRLKDVPGSSKLLGSLRRGHRYLIGLLFLLPLFPASDLQAGFDISGTSSGIFVNPLPAGSYVTGVGTNNFSFGDPTLHSTGPSRLIFTGGPFNTTTEADFLIGSLVFFNGTVEDPVPDSVDFRAQLNFTTPPVGLVNSDFRIQLISTTNSGTPDQNADAVIFPDSFSSTTFALEGIQYTLQIIGFRNVIGDGFLSSDAHRLNAREGGTASAQLFGRVTSAVPEPASLMLLGIGALGLMSYGWHRKASSASYRLRPLLPGRPGSCGA